MANKANSLALIKSDQIHMLVSIPPNISVSEFMGYLIRDRNAIMSNRLLQYLIEQSCNKNLIYCFVLMIL